VTSARVAGVAGIWQKLRRRKVVQWGVAYCAAAWALLQGLEYATTTFLWPQPIQQLATLALMIGLPIVLVLAIREPQPPRGRRVVHRWNPGRAADAVRKDFQ
jgi:hypothetical protein